MKDVSTDGGIRADMLCGLALIPLLLVRLQSDGSGEAGRRLALLALLLAIVHGWALLFAYLSQRPIGAGLVPCTLLFVTLLPGPVAWGGAALAISFGIVFGREIFAGKAILHPTAIALAFALFSFPAGGFEALGMLSGPPDIPLALACIPGAALLAWKRGIAWPAVAGALLGASAAASMSGHPAWWTQIWSGTFAAGIVFLLAEPAVASSGLVARGLHGALVGALVMLFRFADPDQPDAVAAAVLVGGLFAPLLDQMTRWKRTQFGAP